MRYIKPLRSREPSPAVTRPSHQAPHLIFKLGARQARKVCPLFLWCVSSLRYANQHVACAISNKKKSETRVDSPKLSDPSYQSHLISVSLPFCGAGHGCFCFSVPDFGRLSAPQPRFLSRPSHVVSVMYRRCPSHPPFPHPAG